MNGKPYLTAVETSELLGVSISTLRYWRMKGGGPVYIRAGNSAKSHVLYAREDLDAWLAKRKHETTLQEFGSDAPPF